MDQESIDRSIERERERERQTDRNRGYTLQFDFTSVYSSEQSLGLMIGDLPPTVCRFVVVSSFYMCTESEVRAAPV